MGKRKSSSKPQGPKKSDPLPTTFLCLFCNHEDAVTVKINRRGGVGNLNCNICGQTFQCAINYLSAPVDVYSDWVDAADAVTSNTKTGGHFTSRPARKQQLDEIADDDDY
ncbi:hypothetical protein Cpir12675_006821 [Ceratocystis pirilliformis]|uniref:Transcription elongation factor 1 homolog n=1 Tax=Ceratocystis pirilliformis TaxID=259994 RepID=A0ABR3YHQ4_9PEZI